MEIVMLSADNNLQYTCSYRQTIYRVGVFMCITENQCAHRTEQCKNTQLHG